jgi:hypothetical protein
MPMWGVAARSLRFCAERLLGGDVQEPYTDRPTLCR